ncbi:MAG: 2-oxo acid dehydrogenase subunit E2 [Bacteroidia bacterium]|jgi:2-oxoglutarate dehydrogenase E2 component (dihydrolipoamide succinyltransferase)|nr:2-oxo acid dehydrogenase subunit E2 [Bacteroidia bacterium]GIV23491.1 MAG: dihydrolipoamide acetyltransferase component of pyruvate dehydrogenase complex [Bacteroidia bacterium]
MTELVLPKMGESVTEARVIRWLKKPGDHVEADEPVLEIATDKVDSEVPAPTAGVLTEIRVKEGETVPVGTVLAIIMPEGVAAPAAVSAAEASPAPSQPVPTPSASVPTNGSSPTPQRIPARDGDRFYSPLVRTIAQQEGVTLAELAQIPGSGAGGRVTKQDLLAYLAQRTKAPALEAPVSSQPSTQLTSEALPTSLQEIIAYLQEHFILVPKKKFSHENADIVEMDRMRKLIAENMVYSKHVSPHVTSFVEADVTHLVLWREKVKEEFERKYGEKLTFTHVFVEILAKVLREYPQLNASVEGDKILLKRDIHIGVAVALPNNNLIVPVVRHADRLNLAGIAAAVNDLSRRARANQLKPDEISGGTYTLSNVGTFGNVMGTPVILQPQVAILATGAIRKKPDIVETPAGDVIAIRHKMFLSHSYDHRVIDGALGGAFVRRVADLLEAWDLHRPI